jgi:hypothetical protein
MLKHSMFVLLSIAPLAAGCTNEGSKQEAVDTGLKETGLERGDTAGRAGADVIGIQNSPAYQNRTQLTARPVDYATARGVLPQASSLPASAFDNNVSQLNPRVTGSDGRGPSVDYKGSPTQLVDPSSLQLAQSSRSAPIADAVGSGGIQFTSSAVFPAAADTAFPQSTTGKLWFTINGAWYICSGSMIKPGVVVTAGHCVHPGNGSGAGWYANWQFAPAYRNGSAPYGIWTSWAYAATTSTWFSGGGGVPNDADYAVIVFNKNASGYRIGDYTGYLGWQYPSLIGKHVTAMGYPGNLDGGVINHRVDSAVNQGGGNTGVWGSDMTGGSSGGGVIFNFGVGYSGSSTGWEFGQNRLVSVVSYGYTDGSIMVQGGSQFDSRWQSLINGVCTSYPWAC